MSKNSINSPCSHVGSIDDDGDGDSVFINDDDSNVSRVVIGVLEVYTVE